MSGIDDIFPSRKDPSRLTEADQQYFCHKMRRIRARMTSPPCQRLHLRLVASHGVILDNAWLQLPPEASPETERRRFYALMLQKAADMGYKPGWAAYRFRDKFGSWPPNDFRSMRM